MSKEMTLDQINTNKLAAEIIKNASESRNEEELKIRIEVALRPILKKWGIQSASYEHRHEISGARKDALYGTVIIEYKAPGKLESKSEFTKAKEQVKKYIKEEALDPKYFGRYFGVIIDGYKISFVRFRKNEWEEQKEPLEINAQTVLRLLESIRGLRRKPIDAEFLLIDFGPKSEISKKTILVLYKALIDRNKPRTDMLFNDWKRVFSQVCAYSPEKLTKLIGYYGLQDRKDIDAEKLMFAIHTYYTILMELLTSEIVTLFADGLLGSYLKRLEEAYYRSHEEMLNELRDLEEGGIFHTIGIRNFLEGDYFAWYLDEWNEKVASSIFEITKRLLDYEPATVELNPERVKDLFKRLYQNLVSRDIRHRLGEYFTPDWLAELLIEEVGYDGNPDRRVLDPACGSGTFLVLTIKKIREYAKKHFLDERELINKIINNVRGIDLNPLAVLASKANYLIALSDLLRYRPREGFDIPIYLADSISVERTVTLYGEEEYTLHTTEGKFWVTREVIDKNLLYPVFSLIEECVKLGFTKEDFERSLSRKIPLTKASVNSFIRLYKKIYDLEYKYHRNRIWISLLKNSFAPMLMRKFDYVIGNPPWINWENLPAFYRDNTKHLWDKYGLLKRTKGMGLGKVKKDIAMLFVARCFGQYVNNDGKLAFLIPFTTYKTQAGAGFRNYLANKCEVEKIHDLVELSPFEKAVNRTSLLVIKEGKTKFPIPCTMWSNPRSRGMPQEAELEEVKKTTRQFDMIFAPIKKGKPETPWMIISERVYLPLQKIIKPSEYKAHAGVCTWADGIFWVKILSKQPSGVLISNVARTAKKKYKKITKLVEPEFLFPIVRGKNHKKWYIKSEGSILLPISSNGKVLSEKGLKLKYPKTYTFFLNFSEELQQRSGYKQLMKRSGKPFYSVLRSKYGVMPYKVVWKRIAGKISGKALFECCVIPDEVKPIIPSDRFVVISCKNEREAYYVCSVLNSSFASLIVASYGLEVHVTNDVPRYVYIPQFNPQNKPHIKLSNLSKKAHELAKKYYEQDDSIAQYELKKVEEEIDRIVAELYGITDEELDEIRKTLRILKEGKVEE